MREHVKRWNKERPQPGGAFGTEDEIPPIQALAWLSAEASRYANVPRGTLERLLATGPRARVAIELRIAEAISLALDQPGVMYDDRVVVSPNPHASVAARAECCSGSTREEDLAVAL